MGMRDLLQLPSRLASEPDDPTYTQLAGELMNQQCWCWGRDITRPEGNLLRCFGFQRTRPPEGVPGSSRYRLGLPTGQEVSLWGFGAMIADRKTAIYVNRFEFQPSLCRPTETCWRAADLPSLRRPTSSREFTVAGALCAELLRFIGEYESWVAEAAGMQYRQQAVDAFQHATHTALEAKQLWPRLAKRVTRYYARRAATSCIVSSDSRCA